MRLNRAAQLVYRLRRVSKEAVADRSLAADEPPDGALIDLEAPRRSADTAKQLDTVCEVFLSSLHAGDHR